MKIEEVSDPSSYKFAKYILSVVLVLLAVICLMYSYTFFVYLASPYVAPQDYPTFSGTVVAIGRGAKSGSRILVDNGKEKMAFKFSCRSSPVDIGDTITIASLDLMRDPVFAKPRTSIIRKNGVDICRDGTVGRSGWRTSKILSLFSIASLLLTAFYSLKLARSSATDRSFDFSLRWR